MSISELMASPSTLSIHILVTISALEEKCQQTAPKKSAPLPNTREPARTRTTYFILESVLSEKTIQCGEGRIIEGADTTNGERTSRGKRHTEGLVGFKVAHRALVSIHFHSCRPKSDCSERSLHIFFLGGFLSSKVVFFGVDNGACVKW